MKRFPYYLYRVAGLPFEALSRFNFGQTAALSQQCHTLSIQLEALKEPVCALLYTAISAETEPAAQRKLIDLKRKIYNDRLLGTDEELILRSRFTTAEHQAVQEYLDLYAQHRALSETYAKSYTSEIVQVRNRFKDLVTHEEFQKGLLLSSQLLLAQIEPYRNSPSDKLRKKERKTEESLVKYISRMAAKTSPFSTFTQIALGRPEAEMPPVSESRVRSHICLNNTLYGFLRSAFFRIPELYRELRIQLNPTLEKEEEGYLFLINHNNLESFQRLPAHPAVNVVCEVLETHKGGMVYRELVEQIVKGEYFDAGIEEVESLLDELISFGLVEYQLEVSGLDPYWDTKLIAVLEAFPPVSPLIAELIEVLRRLREYAGQYAEASLEARRVLLEQAHAGMKEVSEKLLKRAAQADRVKRGEPEEEPVPVAAEAAEKPSARKANKPKEAEKEKSPETEKETEVEEEEPREFRIHSQAYFYFTPEKMFYEDTTLETESLLTDEELDKLTSAANDMVFSLSEFEMNWEERENMAAYFCKRYGENETVSVLRFYEDFYREVKKPLQSYQKKMQARKKDEPELELTEEWKKAMELSFSQSAKDRLARNQTFLEKLEARFDAETAQLEIPEKRFRHEGRPEDGKNAYSVFAQVYRLQENGQQKLRAVLNASTAGFGKFFSRFVHTLDEVLHRSIFEWNTENMENDLFIENCDSSVFNANIHPPLMPYEICMPGSQNALPVQAQVSITDLSLVYDANEKRLRLRHRETGRFCEIFDLGFQGWIGRSELFQLLTRFSPQRYVFWGMLSKTINERFLLEQQPGVAIWPRVTIGDTLVVQRKSWRINRETIPLDRFSGEEAQVFLQIDAWRRSLGLPDEVFVAMSDHQEVAQLPPEEARKLSREAYKPQYIHFSNPLLVDLLVKMLHKLPRILRVQEMLPSSEQLLSVNGKPCVTEVVVEWKNTPAS